MRSVLLVTYTFPPQYDVSARRAASLVRFLPASGWRPIVLTKDWSVVAPEDRAAYAIAPYAPALEELAQIETVRTPYRTRDNVLRRAHQRLGGAYPCSAATLTAETSPRSLPSRVARKALSVFSPLFGDFPDAFRGWVDSAVPVGVELVRSRHVDAICSLCPPASAHVVASEIARRTGVPWVAQFDDLFSFHLGRDRRTLLRRHAARAHRSWMRRARLAGAITPGMLEYVHRTYGIDGGVVMVGFEPTDEPCVEPPRGDRMRLVYTGSVYLDDHRPEILFEALDQVLATGHGDTPALEVRFIGTRREAELRERLARFPHARRACTFIDRLDPSETLRAQREADALVLFNYTTVASDAGTLSFPAKSFEYLNAGRPILALPRDPGGWGDDLLQATGAGVSVSTPQEAASVLRDWLRAWCNAQPVPYAGDRSIIARYAAPRQAAALAALLDRAVGSASGG